MRQSPAGIYIYSDTGTTEVPLTEARGAYAPELDELYDALVYDKPVLHSGRWGWRRWRSASPSCSRRRHTGTSRCSTRLPFLRACRGKIS